MSEVPAGIESGVAAHRLFDMRLDVGERPAIAVAAVVSEPCRDSLGMLDAVLKPPPGQSARVVTSPSE